VPGAVCAGVLTRHIAEKEKKIDDAAPGVNADIFYAVR
jgi:hypothetical protein